MVLGLNYNVHRVERHVREVNLDEFSVSDLIKRWLLPDYVCVVLLCRWFRRIVTPSYILAYKHTVGLSKGPATGSSTSCRRCRWSRQRQYWRFVNDYYYIVNDDHEPKPYLQTPQRPFDGHSRSQSLGFCNHEHSTAPRVEFREFLPHVDLFYISTSFEV